MPANPETDTPEFNPQGLRRVGRRGTPVTLDEAVAIISEESATAFEGLFRLTKQQQRQLAKLDTAIFLGEDDEVSLMEQFKEHRQQLQEIHEQLTKAGFLKKKRIDKITGFLFDVFKMCLPFIGALILYKLKLLGFDLPTK